LKRAGIHIIRTLIKKNLLITDLKENSKILAIGTGKRYKYTTNM